MLKKSIVVILLALAMVFAFASCKVEKVDEGATPAIEISEDGYWVINGEKTNVKAKGEDGADGKDAVVTDENPQGLAFYLKDDGTYAVEIGYAKYLSKIVIPATYKGKKVSEVGLFGYSGVDGNGVLKEVVISEGVEAIGAYAFKGCFALESVTIPGSVTTIGEYAFRGCNVLSDVSIPGSVTTIGSYAFSYCYGLTSMIIPDSVTSIGEYAFGSCYGLAEVINHSALDITAGSDENGGVGKYAIEVHTGESKIVDKNGYLFYTYDGANYLLGYTGTDTEITLPDGYNGQNYEIYGCAFIRDDLTSVIIPESVTAIRDWAFNYCYGLTSIVVPESVTRIGYGAFCGCSNLKSITVPFVGETKEGTENTNFAYIFGGSAPSSLKNVTITGGYIAKNAFGWCYDVESVIIGDGVVGIGIEAFVYCTSLTSVTIPDSVTTIGSGAFSGCTSLTSVTIPDSVTTIDSYAFSGCTSLTSVTIPDSVTTIGGRAFEDCTSLTSVTIPDSVTTIGEYAFRDCTSLTSVVFENPTGWRLSESTLSDPAAAAEYLKNNYYDLTRA